MNSRRLSLPVIVFFLFGVFLAQAAPPQKPENGAAPETSKTNGLSLLPLPVSLEPGAGVFKLGDKTTIIAMPGTETEAEKLAFALRTPTGLSLPVSKEKSRSSAIVLELDTSLEAKLGTEGYQLSIKPDRVVIRAAAEGGLFYGGVTFRQLLPPEIFGKPATANVSWSAPCVKIEDSPRFPWRGMLLDVSRHFCPIEFVKKLVDVMAMHKLNTLHWHLVDDQGWRIEIKKYPRLTEVGSIRAESPKKNDRAHGDGTPYGPFFYTHDQIRDLVAYAE
jgi:hexosaminidase